MCDSEVVMTDKVMFIGSLFEKNGPGYSGAVWDMNYIAPTINTAQGGLRMPLTIVKHKEKVDKYRFYEQAIKVMKENDVVVGDIIDAFNGRVNSSGISPTITTRPEGFKTAILVVVIDT